MRNEVWGMPFQDKEVFLCDVGSLAALTGVFVFSLNRHFNITNFQIRQRTVPVRRSATDCTVFQIVKKYYTILCTPTFPKA